MQQIFALLLCIFFPFTAYYFSKSFNIVVMNKKSLPLTLIISLFFASFIALFYILSSHASIISHNKKCIIAIDAGHGGFDPGKVSKNGVKEKEINLEISKRLQSTLNKAGYSALLSRQTDCSLNTPGAPHPKLSDLQNRTLFFQKSQATIAICIHQNSYSDSSVHGTQIFYSKNNTLNEQLATCIEYTVSHSKLNKCRPSKCTNQYYILSHSTIPTILIECGFLSNPEEEMLLSNSDYQQQLCQAITAGIQR